MLHKVCCVATTPYRFFHKHHRPRRGSLSTWKSSTWLLLRTAIVSTDWLSSVLLRLRITHLHRRKKKQFLATAYKLDKMVRVSSDHSFNLANKKRCFVFLYAPNTEHCCVFSYFQPKTENMINKEPKRKNESNFHVPLLLYHFPRYICCVAALCACATYSLVSLVAHYVFNKALGEKE